jgi:hypothetical protein
MGGLYRDAYVVGCSTHSEAKARIRRLYPSEPNLTIYVSPLQIGAAENLRLARDEVRSWQCGPDVALWSSKFAPVGGLFVWYWSTSVAAEIISVDKSATE